VIINPGNHPTLVGIDSEVLTALKERAEPFVDDPNTVIRRVLGLGVKNGSHPATPMVLQQVQALEGTPPAPKAKPSARDRRGAGAGPKPPRAPKGSLTPEDAFEEPILTVLERAGGELPVREILGQVGDAMADVLNSGDLFEDNRGIARWEKRAHFVRLKLVERGLLSKDAPRGTWEITDEGRQRLLAGTR
jgi:hypothetical protein